MDGSDALGADIIVTARRREEVLQDVPVSVTAVTPEELRNKTINNAYDLMSTVPGVNVIGGSTSANSPQFVVRGQGTGVGGLPSTVQYFAEVPLSGNGRSGGLSPTFFDLESIQVLKGPQGTLFGRSSTGGAVLIGPRRPTHEFDGYADISYGNYNTVNATGVINVPFGDHIALRVAANLDRNDGYAQSLVTGQRLGDRNRLTVRVGLLVEPTDWLSNYLMFQDGTVDESNTPWVLTGFNPKFNLLNVTDATAGTALTNIRAVCGVATGATPTAAQQTCMDPRIAIINSIRADWTAELARLQNATSKKAFRRTNTTRQLFDRSRSQLVVNNTQIKLGGEGFVSDITLKNIFSLQKTLYATSTFQLADSAIPNNTIGFYAQNYNRTTNLAYDDGRSSTQKWGGTFSEEVQLSAKIHELHDLTLGYSLERTDQDGGLNVPTVFISSGGAFGNPIGTGSASGGYFPDIYVKQGGFFGQATIDFADFGVDGLKFTGGFRRSFYDTSATSVTAQLTATTLIPNPTAPLITGDYHEKENSYTLTVEYKPTDDVLLYVARRRGFKSGGINRSVLTILATNPDARESFGPEILQDWEVGAKTEWMLGNVRGIFNISAYYAKVSGAQVGGSIANNGVPVAMTINAGKSRYRGIEVEASALLTRDLRLDLNYAFFDGKNLVFPGFVTDINGLQVSRVLTPILNMPKHKLDATASYTFLDNDDLGKVAFSANLSYQSSVVFSDSILFDPNYKPQKSFALGNLRLSWDNVMGNPVDLSLFVKNVTNKLYRISDGGNLATQGYTTALYGAPRTVGVQLRARFGKSAK